MYQDQKWNESLGRYIGFGIQIGDDGEERRV